MGTLRSATGYLNEQIARVVAAADADHRDDGVRFHFLDISRGPYGYSGNPRDRHGLCSRDPWLNGITPGITSDDFWEQSRRSFHPHQTGHTNTAWVLADLLRADVTFDDAPAGADATGVDLLNATIPSGACGDEVLGWPHDPIPLVNGEGESVAPSGGFGGAVGLIGAPITGGDSNGAQRQITEISLAGATVVTTESIIYPEQYSGSTRLSGEGGSGCGVAVGVMAR